MKAVVTGATGQLGRALLRSVPPGWDCVALDRSQLDLSRPEGAAAVIAALAPDLVLNAAAYTAVDAAESDVAAAEVVNSVAPGMLARAAECVGAHFVHVSTDFVFDGTASSAYCPADTRNPLGVYGRTKAAGEDAVGPGATIVRTAWVYAAQGSNFVNTMIRLMRIRDDLRVVADQIGAPTWAGGLADVVWALGAERRAGIWHHSDAGVASWYDFAVAIQEEARALGLLDRTIPVLPIATDDYPTPAKRPAFSLLDSSATRVVLGMAPVHWRVNLRTMLAELARLEGPA